MQGEVWRTKGVNPVAGCRRLLLNGLAWSWPVEAVLGFGVRCSVSSLTASTISSGFGPGHGLGLGLGFRFHS
ncbi:hypothetical protein ACLKA6_010907 [Drosophila palustris]